MSTKDPVSLLTLPNELKEEVFLYLSSNDLLNVMQTCKTFNSYVEDNKNLMRKFTVKVSNLISSKVASLRKYQRIFVDIELTEDLVETVQELFINMTESVEVMIIKDTNEKFPEDVDSLKKLVRSPLDLLDLCPSLKTVNVLPEDLKDLDHRHINLTERKSLNFFCPASNFFLFLALFQPEEINLYNGLRHSKSLIFKLVNLRSLNVFNDGGNKVLSIKSSTVYEITFHNCSSVPRIRSDDSKITKIKLINCKINDDPSDFFDEHVKVDELLIENCGRSPLWLQDSRHEGKKVKHLKLVNMEISRKYLDTIEVLRSKVEELTMIDVVFKDHEEEEPFVFNENELDRVIELFAVGFFDDDDSTVSDSDFAGMFD